MNQTLDCPVLGLDVEFPERLFILKHPSSGKYGCYCFQGVHGLACFSTEHGAYRFAEWLEQSGMATEEVAFEEAREIAKNRPMPVVSVMLLDDIADPKIHFVR